LGLPNTYTGKLYKLQISISGPPVKEYEAIINKTMALSARYGRKKRAKEKTAKVFSSYAE